MGEKGLFQPCFKIAPFLYVLPIILIFEWYLYQIHRYGSVNTHLNIKSQLTFTDNTMSKNLLNLLLKTSVCGTLDTTHNMCGYRCYKNKILPNML